MPTPRGLLRARISVVAVALVLSIPAATLAARNSGFANIRIDNFGQLNAAYFRGAQPEGRDFADLAAIGVKTVIDLQADGMVNEQRLVEAAGMKFFRIPMTTRINPTAAQLDQFLKLVNDPAHQPVYVHCAGGRHRTGVMTAVYRMTNDGWTAQQAFKEMKRYDFGLDFLHPEFKKFVFSYRVAPGVTSPSGAPVTVASE